MGEGKGEGEEEDKRSQRGRESGILGYKCQCTSYNYMPGCRIAHADKLAPQCSSSPRLGWRAAGVGKGRQVDRQACRPHSGDSQAATQRTARLNSLRRVVIVLFIYCWFDQWWV